MKGYLFLVVAIVAAMTTSGCATTYQNGQTSGSAFTGGYGIYRAPGNLHRITYSGNALVEPERIRDFAMLRTAEFALENRKPYFHIYENLAEAASNTTAARPVLGFIRLKPTARAYVLLLDEKQDGAHDARALYQQMTSALGVPRRTDLN